MAYPKREVIKAPKREEYKVCPKGTSILSFPVNWERGKEDNGKEAGEIPVEREKMFN